MNSTFDVTNCPKSYIEMHNRIASIQIMMEDYIKSSIRSVVLDNFIYGKNSSYYLNPEIIDKCNEFIFPHYLTQPIHDVVADVFRYKYQNGIERPIFEEDIKSYFSGIYKDTYFLEKIEERDWLLCKIWYDFVMSAIMDPSIMRNLGYCFYYFIEDDKKDHQHHRSLIYSYKAANSYQMKHQEKRRGRGGW